MSALLVLIPISIAWSESDADVTAASGAWVGMTMPSAEVEVASNQSGRITELPVAEGDSVEANQLLFKLSTAVHELEVARLKLLAESTSDIDEAQIQADYAAMDEQRAADLHHRGIGGGANLDEKQRVKRLTKVRLDRARRDHEVAKIRWHEAEQRLAQRHVKSPFPGYVSKLMFTAGQSIQPGATVIKLVKMDPLLIEFDCPIEDADRIHGGDEFLIRQAANPEQSRLAKVVHASLTADAASQTFRVRLQMHNPGNQWRTGMKVWIESKDHAKAKPGRLPGPGK